MNIGEAQTEITIDAPQSACAPFAFYEQPFSPPSFEVWEEVVASPPAYYSHNDQEIIQRLLELLIEGEKHGRNLLSMAQQL